jgi:hypothetical protein
MYHFACDWCGEQIKTQREPYVETSIQLISLGTDRLGKREQHMGPTRFFHARDLQSVDELDRLGIEVKHEEIGDCCYTRALKQLEGVPVTDPGAGLEWRLVPVEGDEKLAGGPVRVKGKLVERDDELEAFCKWHTARAPGQRIALRRALDAGNIETFQLLTELTDQDLRSLPGIGPRIVAAIREYEHIVAEDRRKVEAR